MRTGLVQGPVVYSVLPIQRRCYPRSLNFVEPLSPSLSSRRQKTNLYSCNHISWQLKLTWKTPKTTPQSPHDEQPYHDLATVYNVETANDQSSWSVRTIASAFITSRPKETNFCKPCLSTHMEIADDELQTRAGSSTGNQHLLEAQEDHSSETLWQAAPVQTNTSEHV